MNMHLHVGVTPENLHELTRQVSIRVFDGDTSIERATIHGDGWECWGEAVGTDVNDETLHVIIPVASAEAGETLAKDLESAVPLARMTASYQAGIWAVVTDAEDWEIEVWKGRD